MRLKILYMLMPGYPYDVSYAIQSQKNVKHKEINQFFLLMQVTPCYGTCLLKILFCHKRVEERGRMKGGKKMLFYKSLLARKPIYLNFLVSSSVV